MCSCSMLGMDGMYRVISHLPAIDKETNEVLNVNELDAIHAETESLSNGAHCTRRSRIEHRVLFTQLGCNGKGSSTWLKRIEI